MIITDLRCEDAWYRAGQCYQNIRHHQRQNDLCGIGASIPGPLDPESYADTTRLSRHVIRNTPQWMVHSKPYMGLGQLFCGFQISDFSTAFNRTGWAVP